MGWPKTNPGGWQDIKLPGCRCHGHQTVKDAAARLNVPKYVITNAVARGRIFHCLLGGKICVSLDLAVVRAPATKYKVGVESESSALRNIKQENK